MEAPSDLRAQALGSVADEIESDLQLLGATGAFPLTLRSSYLKALLSYVAPVTRVTDGYDFFDGDQENNGVIGAC